jgi:aminoglycoside phosphotransferase (APT) family kinase protein
VRVGDHFVVKHGEEVHLQEGENMLFIRQASCVPVPTVYALFHDPDTNKNFIIMEYIPGKPLEGVCGGLNYEEERTVASQLRRCMKDLRSIPFPGYYGGIWRQPTREFHFQDPERLGHPHRDNNISQPHETQEQWADSIWLCVNKLRPVINTENPHALTLLRQHYRTIFQGHHSVFTHSNLFPGNIMIRDDTKNVVIIDWERAGWYPTFWKYTCAMMSLRGDKTDWGHWVSSILDEYLAKLGWMFRHRDLSVNWDLLYTS